MLLTKALGTGVISTAIKKGVAKQAWIDGAVASMTTLNKAAAEVVTTFEHGSHASKAAKGGAPSSSENNGPSVRALTDITGFGLIGHAREMALASDVSLRLHARSLPLLEGALECVRAGHIPGGLNANRDFAECVVNCEEGIPDDVKTLLFDPQTSGGLLIAVVEDRAVELQKALNSSWRECCGDWRSSSQNETSDLGGYLGFPYPEFCLTTPVTVLTILRTSPTKSAFIGGPFGQSRSRAQQHNPIYSH